MKNSVLIIDTDLENCKQIKYNLQNTDTEVYYTHSTAEAIHLIHTKPYTLIIMDVILSVESGVDILSEIRELDDAPILALSEQANSAERALALYQGADDVLSKPYDLDECLARAWALMRRCAKQSPVLERGIAIVGSEELFLDTCKRKVVAAGETITLTRKEYGILLYMITHPNQVLTFEQIYSTVWNEPFLGDNSTIFYHVAKLRKKLGGDWIESIYGVGYRMRSPKF